MNCRECLKELSTTSLRDMTTDSAVMQHCATCPDCAELTTSLRQREYEAATILNTLPPLSNPLGVAETSATLARRRAVGRIVVLTSGVVGAIIIAVVSSTMVIPALVRSGVLPQGHEPARQVTEIIPLSCLSPQQAADIIEPYVRSDGSAYFTPSSGIAAITVRGTPDEVARSVTLIREFENDPSAACRHNVGTTLSEPQRVLEAARPEDVKPALAEPVRTKPFAPKKQP